MDERPQADPRALLPGRLLRHPGPPHPSPDFAGVRIEDERLAAVLSPDAVLLELHAGAVHSEGTVWNPRTGRLCWSDIPNRRVLQWRPDGRVSVAIDATWFINGNALDAQGRLVHCEHGRRCISRTPAMGEEPALYGDDAEPIVTRFEGRRLNSPNDVIVAPDGAIWFTDPTFGLMMPSQGSLAEPELDHRSVYRFDPADGSLRRMADFEQPNGLALSPDGRTLFVSDTGVSNEEAPEPKPGHRHEIQAFDVGADGRLHRRRTVHRSAHGVPDGFKLDRRGWIWATAADGIHVIEPDGGRLGHIPTAQTCANLCFGGADGRRVFIAAETHLLAIDLLPG